MTTTDSATARAAVPAWTRGAVVWLRLSVLGALLAAAGNIAGLVNAGGVYGKETSAFIDQAIAQDAVNLAVVSPAIVVLAVLARRGSLRAYLMWLGGLAFTTYNYVIYTMSVHVGPLFLVWIAVLGLSAFSLIGGLAALDAGAVGDRFGHAPQRLAGWFLIAVAALFTLLWLKDIVPAILDGRAPQSVSELALPSSPVHVLDLSFFLPAAFATGVLLLRGRPWSYTTAPGLLVFLALTGLPIIVTPFVAEARGDEPAWAVLPPIGVITIACLAVLARLTHGATPPRRSDEVRTPA
ncbi:hypothetical protein N5079_18355 [Planotetraspora sp. A-T 1434]|uniref:hypothetical protein n=1 Tax=Planotetraspora sp. A-T 1434 TaxID=2979219 RepID=UPI0021C04A27|nr:hypothetical protein [Planotetraspora sp. A-T 1434]MCT9932167.1 hypothetical protein [Planotetraspora sp. A-T 1434]